MNWWGWFHETVVTAGTQDIVVAVVSEAAWLQGVEGHAQVAGFWHLRLGYSLAEKVND